MHAREETKIKIREKVLTDDLQCEHGRVRLPNPVLSPALVLPGLGPEEMTHFPI